MKNLILASGSPRRSAILREAGYDPVIRPADVDETLPEGISGRDAVMFLSLKKAMAAQAALSQSEPALAGSAVILAADTIVYDNEIMGKPSDKAEAREMILRLAGRHHQVITGVTLLDTETGLKYTFADTTAVHCLPVDPADLEAYLDTPEPYDKAGAYAIQGWFGKYISHIDGSFTNVVGLPLERTETYLKDLL